MVSTRETVDSQRPYLKLTAAERRSLQKILRQQGRDGMALRATILLLSAEGESASTIARALGLTPRAVYNCRRRWHQLGLKGLEDAPRSGRPSRVTAHEVRGRGLALLTGAA